MTLSIIQLVFSVLACCGTFFLWRRVAASSRTVAWLVTAGVLARAVGGVAAFWISYLKLPIARSLQLGDGLWIFGLDAKTYFEQAAAAAQGGTAAIIWINKTIASPFYVQSLAFDLLLLGSTVSAALLLNIAAYLACCRIVLSFGDPKERRAVVFAIGTLSLAPSLILLSLQPMKDIWFLFLVTSFFGAARAWQKVMEAPTTRRQLATAALWSAVMFAVVYGISGIRWYYGMVIVFAAVPFVFLLRSPRRLVAIALGVILIPLLFGAVLFAAADNVKPIADDLVDQHGAHLSFLPHAVLSYVNRSRTGFESSGGATMIGAGKSIQKMDQSLGTREVRVLTSRPEERTPPKPHREPNTDTATDQTAAKPPEEKQTETKKTEPAPTDTNQAGVTPADTKQSTPKPVDTHPATAKKTDTAQPPTDKAKQNTTSQTQEHPAAATQTAPSSTAKVSSEPHTAPQPAPKSPQSVAKPAQEVAKPVQQAAKPSEPVAKPHAAKEPAHHTVKPTPPHIAKKSETAPTPAPAPAIPPQPLPKSPTPAPVTSTTPEVDTTGPTIAMPSSPVTRMLAGITALVLPRAVAKRLGILEVGGGRGNLGLWLFVEIDTLLFDFVLAFALVSLINAVRRRQLSVAMFCLMFIVTATIGAVLAYTVSNFGTLFRHRDMVLLGLALLPLATMAQKRERPAVSEPVPYNPPPS